MITRNNFKSRKYFKIASRVYLKISHTKSYKKTELNSPSNAVKLKIVDLDRSVRHRECCKIKKLVYDVVKRAASIGLSEFSLNFLCSALYHTPICNARMEMKPQIYFISPR